MPKANSEQFVVPTETDIAIFASLMTHIEAGYPLKAAEIAGQQGYELVRYTDRGDDNAQSLLLRELKPIQHGWGLYAFRINPTNNIIIEAPHPIFDRRTPQIALNLYRILDAKALLVAGAHRRANIDGSADVAHNPISIFHTVHLVLTYSENSTVLQIHGFSTAKRPGFPQVILNSNQETFPAELNRLANVLGAEGLQVKICGVDGWQDLCGRTNSQLNSMEQGVFIHVELADSLRQENKALINAIIALDLLSENSSDAIQMQPPR